jgi:hypothetical protein
VFVYSIFEREKPDFKPLKGVDWCVEVHVHCNVFVRIDIWSALLGKEFDPKRTRKRKKEIKKQ